MSLVRPLILTGGPAVGKSTTGLALARLRPAAAFLDVDDIRQLVVAGAATVWQGPAGQLQMDLAARNARALASNFRSDGFDSVIADVVDAETIQTYRELMPDALIVHLVVSLAEARRRAATRRVWLMCAHHQPVHRSGILLRPVRLHTRTAAQLVRQL